jgi:hypothetical protein
MFWVSLPSYYFNGPAVREQTEVIPRGVTGKPHSFIFVFFHMELMLLLNVLFVLVQRQRRAQMRTLSHSCKRSLWVARKSVFLTVPSVVLRIPATVLSFKP